MSEIHAYPQGDRLPFLEAIPEEPRRRSWAAILVGGLILLIGAVLTGGGLLLAVLGGSIYYLVTGAAMIWAGLLLIQGNRVGALVYAAIVVMSVAWAWWEVGANAWAQVPRVIAPAVLLVA